ncbi:MAG: metal-dependent hydrolase [Flavobacteriaceae bacterium]|nr:metal-dependent hydrolase [Flavobacteriaceae bacterium]
MEIQYLGHAGFQIRFNDFDLVIDPFISGNPLAKNINLDELNPDFILLTHGHQDHILDVESLVENSKATIISNFEVVSWYENKGIQGHPMNHGGRYQFDFGWIKYVNAIHSSVLPDGTYGGNPGGFVIWNEDPGKDNNCIYIAGDTALTIDMKLIPQTCPTLDLAVLPIGDNFTMGYQDAAIAAEFVQASKILGCHFDTFPPIVIDHKAATDHFKNKGLELILLDIGKTLTV